MFIKHTFGSFWVISLIALATVAAKSKYYDEEIRPYEFGYRIEGNQHRHEMKDPNGIINGEFGFITADGTYHQSVYATDENGNFKLISFKSSFRSERPTTTTTTTTPTTILAPVTSSQEPKLLKLLKSCSSCKVLEKEAYAKPSITASNLTPARSQSNKNLASSQNNVVNQNDKYAKKQLSQIITGNEVGPKMRVKSDSGSIDTVSPINIALGISAAGIKASEQIKSKHKNRQELNSADAITTKNTGPSGVKNSEKTKLKREEMNTYNTNSFNEKPSHQISEPVHSIEEPFALQTKSDVSGPSGIKISEQPKLKRVEIDVYNTNSHNEISTYQTSKPVDSVEAPVALQTKSDVSGPSGIKISEQPKLKREEFDVNNTNSHNEISTYQTSKPVHSVEAPVALQTKSEISVPISTVDNIHSKTTQSSKTRLSSKKEINEFIGDVLYRFNYTAGFHGHNEEGDSAGNKRGGYFIIGRDNIRRGVIYVANSNGFIPVVKYEKVSSAEAPQADTEKNAGLKGYQFEWFHKGESKIDNSSSKVNKR